MKDINMNEINNNNKYVSYARKSSEAEDRQTLSLPSQERELNDIAKKLGIKIKIPLQEAKSAKYPYKRPAFTKMVELIEKGEVNSIIVWSPDRLSRNPVDAGMIIYLMDQEKLLEVVTQGQIYRNTPSDKFMLHFQMLNAKLENDNKSVSVKRGMKTKLESGDYPFVAPQGYLNTKFLEKGKNKIVVDLDRFHLVRRIWEMVLSGVYTVPQLVLIADKDWKYRSVKRKRIGGTPISKSGLYHILTNPFYYGWFEVKGVLYKGSHKPMVSKEEFDKVQVLLGRRNKPRPQKHEFPFTGTILCSECGCAITATHKEKYYLRTKNHKVYEYYHCTKKKKYIKCNQAPVSSRELESQVRDIFSKIEIQQEFKEWALKYLKEVHAVEIQDRTTVYKNHQTAYNSIQEKLDKLLDLRLNEQVSDLEYETKKKNLEDERERVKELLDDTEGRAKRWLSASEEAFNVACLAVEKFNNGDMKTKQIMLNSIGSNFLLKDRKLLFDLKKPYFVFKNAAEGQYEDLGSLELVKYASIVTKNGLSEPANPSWLPLVDMFIAGEVEFGFSFSNLKCVTEALA